ALAAISAAEGDARVLGLEGARHLEAFERQFVFVGVTARFGRDSSLLTGSAEVKESPEQSAVLAVLDATNRWGEYSKGEGACRSETQDLKNCDLNSGALSRECLRTRPNLLQCREATPGWPRRIPPKGTHSYKKTDRPPPSLER